MEKQVFTTLTPTHYSLVYYYIENEVFTKMRNRECIDAEEIIAALQHKFHTAYTCQEREFLEYLIEQGF